jgi:hypothetical protein
MLKVFKGTPKVTDVDLNGMNSLEWYHSIEVAPA